MVPRWSSSTSSSISSRMVQGLIIATQRRASPVQQRSSTSLKSWPRESYRKTKNRSYPSVYLFRANAVKNSLTQWWRKIKVRETRASTFSITIASNWPNVWQGRKWTAVTSLIEPRTVDGVQRPKAKKRRRNRISWRGEWPTLILKYPTQMFSSLSLTGKVSLMMILDRTCVVEKRPFRLRLKSLNWLNN